MMFGWPGSRRPLALFPPPPRAPLQPVLSSRSPDASRHLGGLSLCGGDPPPQAAICHRRARLSNEQQRSRHYIPGPDSTA